MPAEYMYVLTHLFETQLLQYAGVLVQPVLLEPLVKALWFLGQLGRGPAHPLG